MDWKRTSPFTWKCWVRQILQVSTMMHVSTTTHVFGWRAGLSFAYGKNSGLFDWGSDVRGYVVPLEVNYLLGSQKNNLELGLGTGLGIYNVHRNKDLSL